MEVTFPNFDAGTHNKVHSLTCVFRVKQYFCKNFILICTEILIFNRKIFILKYIRKSANKNTRVLTDARTLGANYVTIAVFLLSH